MHRGDMTMMGDYIALDKQQQLLSKGSSKDLADLDYIQNVCKGSSAGPIPTEATYSTNRDRVLRRIRQCEVVANHEALGSPLRIVPSYMVEPEKQADSSPKTDNASGDDELPGIKQDLQGQDNIIAQPQKIQDPNNGKRQQREEQSQAEELSSYHGPEQLEGGPSKYKTRRGTAPQALLTQALQKFGIRPSDSDDGPGPDLRARVDHTRARNVEMFENAKYVQATSGDHQMGQYGDLYQNEKVF